ncbi:MAG: hypothetical protein CL759_07690 [Chloroflexi bacterium]|nr:hypothetical protein [Chloroflexota bacterium]MQF94966.1 MFS transporter [SAR202 cluster bacterium]
MNTRGLHRGPGVLLPFGLDRSSEGRYHSSGPLARLRPTPTFQRRSPRFDGVQPVSPVFLELRLAVKLGGAATPLSLLRQRNFGLVWSAITLAHLGAQMETLVVVWYVLNLTDSPFLVGLTATARLGFNFLALFAGATADLVPRRILLAIVQFIMAGLSVIMLTLIATGLMEVWMVFAITLAVGLVRIFQMPTAQSLAVDSVEPERTSNAIALASAGMNIALLAGPLLGGILFDLVGPDGAYVLVAGFYGVSGLAALGVGKTRVTVPEKRESVLSTVKQGLKYVKGEQLLWAALVVAVIINITGFSFHTTMLPIFARDVLDRDSVGLGILISCFGGGALIGSVIWASIPNLRHAGILCVLSVIGWHGTMIVFAASTNFVLSAGILVLTGTMFSSTLVLILTALMQTAMPEYRGRIMGLRTLAIYAHAFGSLAAGAVAGWVGAPATATISGSLGIAMVITLALIAPKFRRF